MSQERLLAYDIRIRDAKVPYLQAELADYRSPIRAQQSKMTILFIVHVLQISKYWGFIPCIAQGRNSW